MNKLNNGDRTLYLPGEPGQAGGSIPISTGRTRLLGLAVLVLAITAAAASAQTTSFDADDALGSWKTTGDVSIDRSRNRSRRTGGSLKVSPGGKALWRLRDTNGSGTVRMWVYDNRTKAADPKEYRVGPRWGILQNDGRVLVVGVLYAPYLSGDVTYAASDSDQRAWFNVQYTAVRRNAGWHEWTFDFDAEKGLSIAYDGKRLPAERFDWHKTRIRGFTSVAVFGDEVRGEAQTIWVDDVHVELAGPVRARPTPSPPPPPLTPAKDPEIAHPVTLLPAVRGRHPRLLFGAADLPRMKALARTEGRAFYDALLAYLPPSVPPTHTRYLSDATEAQRQALWRAPTVGLHYLLTGDATSFERAKGFLRTFVNLPHWETSSETDSGMAAANIMVGAALLYDWLYHDLEPSFRAAARRKLILQARRMYYRGHLMKAGSASSHYWQNDPQNNHRWHRNAGLALCVLAAADREEDGWILTRTYEELKFVHEWLPRDGTSHESPSYMVYGGPHLVMAFHAADRCLGTRFLAHDFFRNASLYRMQTLAPGMKEVFSYGDGGGTGWINHYLWKCTSVHNQPDLQAGLLAFHQANPTAFQYGWFALVWFDPDLTGGSIANLPTSHYFDDLGVVFVREGWEPDGVAMMFKCGPYGGYTLNTYRNRNDFHYVNIAHDDPDANTFQLFTGGEMVIEDDGYSRKKLTASHNTILVNGCGQKGEGKVWTQPLAGDDADMTALARMLTWKDVGRIVVAEGEAGGAYDELQRFRRSMIWIKGSYILVLDDIRADDEVEVTWLVQSAEVERLAGQRHRYRLRKGDARCDLEMAADAPLVTRIVPSTADHHGRSMGLRQLRAVARATRLRVASVFDPWGRGKMAIKLSPAGDESATVTIEGRSFADTWHWRAAPDNDTPSTIRGARNGRFVAEAGPDDEARIPYERQQYTLRESTTDPKQ